MMLANIVGQASFHTAGRSGPSTIERSYLRGAAAGGGISTLGADMRSEGAVTSVIGGRNMRHTMLTRTVFLLLGASFLACGGDREPEPEPAPLLTFDTARVRLVTRADTIPLVVELARTVEQRTM